MELDYKAIGRRIRSGRAKSGLTQEKLAERANLSVTHLSNIETGATRVSLVTLVNIANALSLTLDDLLCESVVKSTRPIYQDIFSAVEDCDEYELRVMRDLILAMKDSLRRDLHLRERYK